MSDGGTITLAVWDTPAPAVAGESFAVKIGAKAADGRSLAGDGIAVHDASGAVVASGALGDTALAGTEALYWLELNVPAPATPRVADYEVRAVAGPGLSGAIATRFSVAAAARPDCTVSVAVAERTSSKPLAGVEVRLGPFRARTDRDGRAALRACKGDFELRLWLTAHIAAPQAVTVDGDASLDLTMTLVPEEHPDARWVR